MGSEKRHLSCNISFLQHKNYIVYVTERTQKEEELHINLFLDIIRLEYNKNYLLMFGRERSAHTHM